MVVALRPHVIGFAASRPSNQVHKVRLCSRVVPSSICLLSARSSKRLPRQLFARKVLSKFRGGVLLVQYAIGIFADLQPGLFRPMRDTSWDYFRVFSAAIQCAETTQELDSVEVAIKLWRIDDLAGVLGPG